MVLTGLNAECRGGKGTASPQRLVAGFHMTLCMLGRRRVIESQRDVLGMLGEGWVGRE